MVMFEYQLKKKPALDGAIICNENGKPSVTIITNLDIKFINHGYPKCKGVQ